MLARRGSLLAIVLVALRAILVILLASLIVVYSSRPPESTLSYDGQAEIGKLGLYRWGEDRSLGPIGNACSSTAPAGSSTAGNVPPFTAEVLEIPDGSRLVFEHGGEEPLTEVSARSFAFEKGGLRVPVLTISLSGSPEGNRAEIPVDLPPGEYGISVHVSSPEATPTTAATSSSRVTGACKVRSLREATGMETYSTDLRERILAATDGP